MARLLALDWDRVEARIVLARASGGTVRVEQMAAVPLELDGQETNLASLKKELGKALSSQRLPKGQALVAIGRSMIELRTLNLPPAPDEELPEMVRFQAMREFSSLKDESPLDFLPLKDAATEPGEVMAAAIPIDLARHVEGALTDQGQELHRSVMRPCSAASLAMRRKPEAKTGITLIIAQQADSAELIVTRQGTVVFTRSFRLPPDWHPGETGEPLLGEVRRTVAAAHNQLGGSRVERIVYFGTQAEHGALCERLEERTKLDVTLVDPIEGISVAGDKPAQPERFASILGMLHDEADDVVPVIDFKNPRKKPEPESNRRFHVLLAATAVTILLGLASLVYMKLNELDEEIALKQGQINQLNLVNRELQPAIALEQELLAWKSSDHNWLDELVHLSSSEHLAAEDFLVESFSARARDGFDGLMEITGRAKELASQHELQTELSDEHHVVIPGLSTRADDGDERYPQSFTTTIRTNRSMVIELPRPNNTQGAKTDTTDKPDESKQETNSPEGDKPAPPQDEGSEDSKPSDASDDEATDQADEKSDADAEAEPTTNESNEA